MAPLLWIPGDGIDTAALARMQSHFPKPKEPMGEAWFMCDDRRMYTELLGDLDALDARTLKEPLVEIAGGTGSFGPHREWQVWFHHLLGATLPRCHETYVHSVLEDLITAFIAIYPDGIEGEPYRGFRDDAIATLGKCLMEPRCWNGSEVAVGEMLHRSCNNPAGIWRWWDASGDFSASMFFCLKYLPEPRVTPWLESVLAIEAPHWRAQVMVWMVGAKEVLEGTVGWPSQFPLSARPSIAWEWSHCLRPLLAARAADGSPRSVNLIPDASRETARRLLATWFDEDRFLDWLTSIASVPYLEAELAEIPSTFESIHVRPNARR